MSEPYFPGHMSQLYHQLPAAERDAVNKEINQLFSKKTGVIRALNPKRDRELVRTWLRIRDEVMTRRTTRNGQQAKEGKAGPPEPPQKKPARPSSKTMNIPLSYKRPDGSAEWRWVTFGVGTTSNALKLALEMAGKGAILAGKLTFTLGLVGLAATAIQLLLALPRAIGQAQDIAKQKGFRRGYAIGVVAAIFHHGPSFVRNEFEDRTRTYGIYGVEHHFRNGYHLGLGLGYRQASELTNEQKELLRTDLTNRIIERAREEGRKIYWMETASDSDWVLRYSAVFSKHHLR